KIIVFKYRPKKHYKKMKGHRQDYTEVRIKSISY
ncbi:MAG: bL21 family ribosomal protein, partial [Armatimonadia bacterium]